MNALVKKLASSGGQVAFEMQDGSTVVGVVDRETDDGYVLSNVTKLVVGGDDTIVDVSGCSAHTFVPLCFVVETHQLRARARLTCP